MSKKDLMVIGFYLTLALLVLWSSVFEPQHCDAIVVCTMLYALSVIPVMAMVKGYIK